MADYDDIPVITAWQCIGCGRLEAPQQCVGICQDRKVELIGAWDYADAVAALEEARDRIAILESALGRLAHVTPRDGTWKESYLALQTHARKILDR